MAPLGATRGGSGPLVVLLHGFTQTSHSMAPIASRLETSHEVLCLDLPGHGGSTLVAADLDESARLVEAATDGAPFDLVGYSLGGRVALHVACAAPEGLRATVTISASIGIADTALREQRLERDLALADDLEAAGDVGAFVERWLSLPMFATLPRGMADVEGRRTNTASGLADSLRRCSVGRQRWMGDELSAIRGSLLMLAGTRDDPYYVQACSSAMRSASVGVAAVVGAGHACHLEQPDLTARLISSFLATR